MEVFSSRQSQMRQNNGEFDNETDDNDDMASFVLIHEEHCLVCCLSLMR